MADDTELPLPGLNPIEIPNLGPIIDPPFSDARDWGRFLPRVETKPVVIEQRAPTFTDDNARRATELALASDRVRRELEGKRYEVMSVGMRALDRRTEHPVVVIYKYTDGITLEVMIDLAGAAVIDVKSARYQPTLTDPELRRALDLIRQDGRIARACIDVDTGVGLIVEDENFRSPRYGHRLVDLRFGPANRRLPTAFAIVDLTSEDVVRLGTIPQ